MICNFENGKWVKEGKGEFLLTEKYAEIRKTDATLSRIKYTMPLSEDTEAINFSVNCDMSGTRSNLSAYAVISQLRADGTTIIQIYGENTNEIGNTKACTFDIKDNCTQIVVELGIKSEGFVRFYPPSLTACEPMPKRPVRIAAPKISPGADKASQLIKISQMIDKIGAEKPDIIVLSEHLNTYGTDLCVTEAAETIHGDYCTEMCKKAKEYNTYIVSNFIEKLNDEYFNTSVLINRNGKISGKYAKTHLAFGEYEDGISPGSEFPVFETDFGHIGMLICWDAFFPEPTRIMTLKGAELLLISTIGDPGFRHVSRALENGIYVAVGGVQHQNLNNKQIGASKIISPTGEILSEATEFGDYAMCEIDLNDKMSIPWLSFSAEGIPHNVYLNERRPDLYNENLYLPF